MFVYGNVTVATHCELFTYNLYNWIITVKSLIIKPTRCINFSNLFLEWNSTCFGQFLCPSSGGFHCTHSNVIRVCLIGLQKSCEQDQDDIARKNKFKKLVHLVGFVIRNVSRCTLTWTSNSEICLHFYTRVETHDKWEVFVFKNPFCFVSSDVYR